MSLEERIKQIIEKKQTIAPQNQQKRSTLQNSYKCSLCNDTTFIEGENGLKRCICFKKEQTLRLWDKAGLTNDLKKRTFANYKPYNAETKRIKAVAGLYVKEYSDKKESIAFIGQPGAGKTHLGIAIMLNFLEMGVGVVYMAYREEITKIKQVVMDDLEYSKLMNRYKRCEVLFIDDLFKGKVTDSDIKIIFEIVNHRYINGRPIIISSELTIDKLLDIDEATASRIYEMTKNYLVEIRGKENNFRLKRG